MSNLWRLAPWINRLVLLAATFIFAMIGLRYITDPVHASAETGVTLNSVLANATTRVGSGAFPLGFAIFSLACLVSTRRLTVGVSLIATVVAVAIVVRIFSMITDGPAPKSTRLFMPEAVILLLALTGLFLETGRRRTQAREVG
jgi:hypothetical protein